MKKNSGIVINFGPEIRPLLLSGLVDELIMNNNNVLILSKEKFPVSQFVSNFPEDSFILLPKSKTVSFQSKIYGKLFEVFNRLWQARMRKLNFGNFHFSKGMQDSNKNLDWFKGNRILFRIFEIVIFSFNKLRNDNAKYKELLESNNIGELYFAGFTDANIVKLLVAAKSRNVKLHYILNNWKDVYTQHYFPVTPDTIAYWGTKLLHDAILLNPFLKNVKSQISGNLGFYRFISYKPYNKKSYYESKYNEDFTNRKLILWPLAQKSVFPNEHLLVKRVNQFISKIESKNRPLLLLRLNPFGLSEDIEKFYKGLENVVLCDNNWQVDRKKDFTYQNIEGENEWTDLLYYTDLIVTVPSTVILEAVFFNKKVINYTFDEVGIQDKRISSFLGAPFYKSILHLTNLLISDRIQDFFTLILAENSQKINIEIPNIIEGNKSSTINSYIEKIIN